MRGESWVLVEVVDLRMNLESGPLHEPDCTPSLCATYAGRNAIGAAGKLQVISIPFGLNVKGSETSYAPSGNESTA